MHRSVVMEKALRAGVVALLVDRGGVYARHDAVSGEAEASQLLWRQDIDDKRSDMGDVAGRRLGECLEAFVGQDGIGEPSVCGIR